MQTINDMTDEMFELGRWAGAMGILEDLRGKVDATVLYEEWERFKAERRRENQPAAQEL